MRKLLLLFLFFCGFLLSVTAQQKTVTGTVVSSVEGEGPLPGVTISVKGTTTGTISDVNGKFALDDSTRCHNTCFFIYRNENSGD